MLLQLPDTFWLAAFLGFFSFEARRNIFAAVLIGSFGRYFFKRWCWWYFYVLFLEANKVYLIYMICLGQLCLLAAS